MPSLGRTLQDLDLGHLRIIAELWGLEMPPGKATEAAGPLARQILESTETDEVLSALPQAARDALEDLLSAGGRAPLTDLQLRHGPLGRAGPGRRDRERPWLNRQAALDGLWYRGLLGLAFYDTPTGPREFAFIPDEFQALLRRSQAVSPGPASPEAPVRVVLGGGAADDAVTLLAALRRRPAKSDHLPAGRSEGLRTFLIHPSSLELLVTALQDMGVVTASPLRPDPESARDLVRAGREAIEARIHRAWFESASYNDLAHVPGLATPGGAWPNDPVLGRAALLELARDLSSGVWYDLETFIDDVRRTHASFFRPGGDFDSWYLRDAVSGRFLRGVEDWEAVEGGYLRFVLIGPLHWLGIIDLGRTGEADSVRRFRLRRPIDPAETSSAAPTAAVEPPPARLEVDGRITFPPGASLVHRYQVARFADWLRPDASGFVYRITPRALATAAAQRLDAGRVQTLLRLASGRELPAPLALALQAWSIHGTQAAFEATLLVRTKDAATMRRLKSDPATARYLIEVLSPTVARVQARDREKLALAAARRGLLIDPPGD